MDIVGAAQADYDAPQLLENGSEQKAGGDTDAVHTYEGEPMKSFEVFVAEQDIIGVKSGVVLDPAEVQAARQKEIDSIARDEVVELDKTSECKQGAHVKGGWVEDNKGAAPKRLRCSPWSSSATARGTSWQCGATSRPSWRLRCSSHRGGTELRVQAEHRTWHVKVVQLLHLGPRASSGTRVSRGSKAASARGRPQRAGDEGAASIAGALLHHALDRPDLHFTVGRLMSAVTKPQQKHLAMMKHFLRYLLGRRCCAWKFDYQEWPGELVILTDAEWASDSDRRRSVDCVHIYHGGDLIEASTSAQQVVSLSTAESEFHRIARGDSVGHSASRGIHAVWLLSSTASVV